MGRLTINMSGDAPSQAAFLKTIANMLIFGMIESLAETHTFADKVGLGSERLHAYVEGLFPGLYAFYSERMWKGGYAALDKVSLLK